MLKRKHQIETTCHFVLPNGAKCNGNFAAWLVLFCAFDSDRIKDEWFDF